MSVAALGYVADLMEGLGIPYALTDTPEPSKELIKELSIILENKGIKTLYA